MSKPWGGSGIGSWAAEAERAELEERENATTTTTPANPQSFPSLKDAITTKPKKKKMTLSEFNTYGSSGSGSGSGSNLTTTRLTHDELLQLPTGPKPRANDEFSGGGGGARLGGGFRDYGDDRRGPPRRTGGGGGGGFDEDRRGGGGGPPRRGGGGGGEFEAMMMPSRADEVDNWATAKRAIGGPTMGFDSGRGGAPSSRYGALGGGSRADEVDNWNFGKKVAPVAVAPPPGRSGGGFGSGFRGDSGGGDWRRGGDRDGGIGGGGGGGGEMGMRPRLVLDPPRANEGVGGGGVSPVAVVKTNKANPFGAARPREEVLAEKGLDWKKLDSEIEAKKVSSSSTSRPTSSQGGGSRPTSSQSNRSENVGGLGEVVVKPRPKVNPFGDAKPREVLLEQKGIDWRKSDFELEHRRVDRPESEEEKALKEEIENLRKELEKESTNDVSQGSEVEQPNLRDLIQIKEKDLEALVRDLDDKVRFGQKAVERPGSGAGRPGSGAGRPGSGAGRFTGFPERPPSQSGSFDGARGAEYMDRPQSRGTGDVWTRPGEERRGGFQGSRDRGFLSNRDFGRSTSRERW